MASRYDLRSVVVQTLFECDFRNMLDLDNVKSILRRNFNEQVLEKSELDVLSDAPEFATRLAVGVLAKKELIDEVLTKAAPEWPIEKIDPMNRTILRVGIYELLFGEEFGTPKKVAINEAVEMSKAYGGETSRKFVNGVLANIYREIENKEI